MKQITRFLIICILLMSFGCVATIKEEVNEVPSSFIDRPTVSYLGPEGTYTEEATQFFFHEDATLVPKETVDLAIEDLLQGNADYAVIPQENTIGGAVINYVDALIHTEGIYVVGEVLLPINQTLMGIDGATLEDIDVVYSHIQGIVQSEAWRKEHLPNAKVEEMDSTAAAASYVKESNNPRFAAIASPGAAPVYGLSVLAENVQITDTNQTRFYVLSKEMIQQDMQTNATLIVNCDVSRIDDVIVTIHDSGLELVSIHDRPDGSYLGKYQYVLEVENPKGITEKQIQVLSNMQDGRYLGSYQVLQKK